VNHPYPKGIGVLRHPYKRGYVMHGYGLPRNPDVGCPDVLDIKTYGLNYSAGGRDYFKNKETKARQRRIWKRIERHSAKMAIQKELDEMDD